MWRLWRVVLGLFATAMCLSLAFRLIGNVGVGIVFAVCAAIPILSAAGRILRFVVKRFT